MKYEQLIEIGKKFAAVPVTYSFEMEQFDPIQQVQILRGTGDPAVLLAGTPKNDEPGYDFIATRIERKITYRDGILTEVSHGRQTVKKVSLQPVLEKLLVSLKTPKISELPLFTGGLIGYFSYDYVKYANPKLHLRARDQDQLADVDLFMVDQVVAYNHATKQVTISQIEPMKMLTKARYETVIQSLQGLAQTIIKGGDVEQPRFHLDSHFKLQFSESEFTEKVAETKKHIVAGDVFQLILSNPQRATMSGSFLGASRRLFEESPASYQFYFRDGDFETLGASPETLITRQHGKLYSYPLAGTRRRGKTEAEDDQFATELTTSEKELSEHNMLIDLGRNDLGRISKFGTVKVTRTRALLKFANVMHLGSKIESVADATASAIDVINAVMPAGTLSGAPKLSAIQIIDDLEKQKRGIYGGCLGYMDFNGDLDLCIGIRLAYRKGDQVVIHSGAGIVADSIPKYEYQEFNNKASAVKAALIEASEEGMQNALSGR